MQKLIAKNSAGYDCISNKFVKRLVNGLSMPLSVLVNMSITKCYVPKNMKLAVRHLLYKGGVKNLLSNYRPILLLFSKILEKVIHKQTVSFLDSNNVISD